MGIAGGVLGLQANPVQQLGDALVEGLLVEVRLMNAQGALNNLLHGHARIEGRKGILEDHGHLSSMRQHFLARQPIQVHPPGAGLEPDLTTKFHIRGHGAV